MYRAAFLDLGTNTFHLLIAEITGPLSWRKIEKRQVAVRLGKGGIHQNKITDSAYQAGMLALESFAVLIRKYRVKTIVAAGTATFREAANGRAFVAEAKKRFGIPIRVLSGSEEARLIYLGVQQAVDVGDKTFLVMDIGGGSVEFVIGNRQKILWKQSFKSGAAVVLGRFHPGDPMTPSERKKIEAFFTKVLRPVGLACNRFRPELLIGSAGSFESFASMMSYQQEGTKRNYTKTWQELDFKQLLALHKKLMQSSRNDRLGMKGLVKMRVDMIVVASLLLNFVLRETGIRKVMLSAYSLKEGMILDYLRSGTNRNA